MKPLGSRFQLFNLEPHHCAASWSLSPDLELSLLGSRSPLPPGSSIPKLCPAPSFGEREGLLMCAVPCLMHYLVCSWEGEGRSLMIGVCPEMTKIHLYLRIPSVAGHEHLW
jgi:hypothetical protein